MAIAFMEFGNPLQDSCDIESYSLAMTAPANAHGIPRRAQIHVLKASKASDYLTGVLGQYCGAGRHIDEVALEIYNSEDSQKPALTYVLKDVIVASVESGAYGQPDRFSLNAKETTVKYSIS